MAKKSSSAVIAPGSGTRKWKTAKELVQWIKSRKVTSILITK